MHFCFNPADNVTGPTLLSVLEGFTDVRSVLKRALRTAVVLVIPGHRSYIQGVDDDDHNGSVLGSIITNWHVENDKSFAGCVSLQPLNANLLLLLLMRMRSLMAGKWNDILQGCDTCLTSFQWVQAPLQWCKVTSSCGWEQCTVQLPLSPVEYQWVLWRFKRTFC